MTMITVRMVDARDNAAAQDGLERFEEILAELQRLCPTARFHEQPGALRYSPARTSPIAEFVYQHLTYAITLPMLELQPPALHVDGVRRWLISSGALV